jgi:hypothetical protein
MGRVDPITGEWIPDQHLIHGPGQDHPTIEQIDKIKTPSEHAAELSSCDYSMNHLHVVSIPCGGEVDLGIQRVKQTIKLPELYNGGMLNINCGYQTLNAIIKERGLVIDKEGKVYTKQTWACKKTRDELAALKAEIATKESNTPMRKQEIVELQTEVRDLRKENKEMRAELYKVKAALADTLDLLQSLAR